MREAAELEAAELEERLPVVVDLLLDLLDETCVLGAEQVREALLEGEPRLDRERRCSGRYVSR